MPDAIISVANFLKEHGWQTNLTDFEKRMVIWHYNRSSVYIDTVLAVAAKLKESAARIDVPCYPLNRLSIVKLYAAFWALHDRRLILCRHQCPAVPADEVYIYLYHFVSLLFYPGHAAGPLCAFRLLRVYRTLMMIFSGLHDALAPVALLCVSPPRTLQK